MGASRAGEPAVFAGGWQAVHDLAKRLAQPAQTQSIPASQIQGIRENHRVRNGDMPAGPAIPGSLFSASSSHQVERYQYQKIHKRKRGKYGPDSRISPTEESAITKAIRTSTSRKGEPVFLPAVGMEFNSAKEAKDFYNLYSWEIGFGIRRGRKKPNGNNYITRQDLVCSCEGLSKREATFRRTGCKAMVRLHRTSDHGWVISQFEMQHNHPCSATDGPNKQWPSHSDIDPMTKDVVQKLRENSRPIERVCNVEDGDMRTFPESAGDLSPSQISDTMEEVDTVAPKEVHLLCELEPSMHIQRMATPVPVEIEEPLAVTEETQPLGSGFSSGGDGYREDEEDVEEDKEDPYEELEDLFPGMNGRWRPMEEEMDPNYIPDDEPPMVTSGSTHELRPMVMEDDGRSLAPSTCLRPDREDSGTLAPAPEIFDRDLGSGHLSSYSPLPASAQTIVADCLLAASEHHLPFSTATRQELTDLSKENEEMKAELGKLPDELNLFRSEAEQVKRENSQLALEARPLCELEPSLPMAMPVPVEMEQPLAEIEETHPLSSGFSSGGDGDGDREDEEDAEEDEEAPYEEPEDPFPGMSGRRRPTEEEMDPNYIPDNEPQAATSGGTRELRRRKRPLYAETDVEDGRRSLAPSTCLRPDREGSRLPASAQTMVADSLLAASEHHLPFSTATRQELTDLSRENEEMKAELGKLRDELNLFRSEAEQVKRENSLLSQDLEKAIAEKHQCRDTYSRARAVLRQLKLELDPGELPPHPQGDDDEDSDSSDACLFSRIVDRLELVPGVVMDQCLKASRFVAQGTVEVVLSHYMRLHPQVGLQLLVEAVLEEDLHPPETNETLALHDQVLEGARRIAHQCVRAPVEDEEDTSAGDAFSE